MSAAPGASIELASCSPSYMPTADESSKLLPVASSMEEQLSYKATIARLC